jgi:hypothetical protein
MPNWSEVLREIQTRNVVGGLDLVRRKYLKNLQKQTGRNVIAYYSGWLQKPGHWLATISDDDKNGFMNAVHKLDRSKGLDLLLHTPGGDLAATESIVDYLRTMFGDDIRAIIPQIAMSGGTMIACACKEIVMGKQSSIGPIDPQFNGIPAHGVIAEFEEAIDAVKKDPSTLPIWRVLIEKYHPTFIGECRNAIDLATQIATAWLVSGMLSNRADAQRIADQIVARLNNHADTKTHARHINAEAAQSFGLVIKSLEGDYGDSFQDTVLTIHHAYMHTFSHSSSIKIVENHLGNAIVYAVGQAKG